MRIASRQSMLVAKRTVATSYYDAVIVGGGMVGNAVACAVGTSPSLKSKKVLLIDGGRAPKALDKPPAVYSNRVSAVSPVSVKLFEKLGVWDRISSYRTKKVEHLRVSESCSYSNIHFDRPRKEEVAYIIENDAIVSALFEKISTLSNVDVQNSTELADCNIPNSSDQMTTLKLANGDVIETSLVIGADGFRSKVRQASQVQYTSWNYEQSGIVATLRVEAPNGNNTAYQRFSELGPIALLPLSEKLSSLVWTTSHEEAKRLCALPQDQFVDELNKLLTTDSLQNSFINKTIFAASTVGSLFRGPTSLRHPLPHVIDFQSDTRAAFPFGFGNSHSYVANRCALVGDAAHRVHPLAGQGVNLGWNDVILLTQVLEKAVKEGADIGSLTYLSEYDTKAQRHNVPIMVSIDVLNRLYSTTAPAIVMARSLGLCAFNSLVPLKDLVVNHLSTGR